MYKNLIRTSNLLRKTILICLGFMIIYSCNDRDWDNPNDPESDNYNGGGQNNALQYGSVTDIEGNTYKTIKIGNQTWMAENLRTTKYNDGTAIPNVTDNGAWTGLNTGAYCWYNNNINNKNPNGALYNWYAVSAGKLCPTGWHVPSDAEWTTLETYLGGSSLAGGKMKSTTGWNSPNTGATNTSGFSALPGGSRYDYDGTFDNVGYYGYWWSSSDNVSSNGFYRYLHYGHATMYRSGHDKRFGFCIRCVRDN
jgi:uncharacterized protein (TIGR02145 family)